MPFNQGIYNPRHLCNPYNPRFRQHDPNTRHPLRNFRVSIPETTYQNRSNPSHRLCLQTFLKPIIFQTLL